MSNIAASAKQNVENEILLIEMVQYLLRRKRLIIVLTFTAMLLASVKAIIEPNRYSSTAS